MTVKAAKQILPADVFRKASADYLAGKIASVTDAAKNGFSSNKFYTFLTKKAVELQAAIGDSPESLAKIKAYTNIMRILPDAPSINPSGTAKTTNLLQKIQAAGAFLKNPIGEASKIGRQERRASRASRPSNRCKILGSRQDISDEREGPKADPVRHQERIRCR